MNDRTGKIRLESLDNLLGASAMQMAGEQTLQGVSKDQIMRIPLGKLHTYHSHQAGHPFRVLDDAKMAETMESIGKHGVLMPGIARPDREYSGDYEIISGHRRKRASELLGLEDMPFIVKDLSDDEATVIMVDSNIQREDLLPSDKAWAYRMKYDALKKLGNLKGIRTDKLMEAQYGESRNSIQRYIRLTYLIRDLLEWVDAGKLNRSAAEELSYLKRESQEQVRNVMEDLRVAPSGEQAKKLRETEKDHGGLLTGSVVRLVLERQPESSKVSLPTKRIRQYFPESYTGEQIEKVIYDLLEEWQLNNTNKVM